MIKPRSDAAKRIGTTIVSSLAGEKVADIREAIELVDWFLSCSEFGERLGEDPDLRPSSETTRH